MQQQQSMSLIDQKQRVMQGWVKKKSPKGFLAKMWQSRFLVLYEDVLQYFRKEHDANPAGVIPLQTVTSVASLSDKKNGCRFDLSVTDETDAHARTFCFLTDTDAECEQWVAKLKPLIAKYAEDDHHNLDISKQGKFWKNTLEIRQARARSSSSWGHTRYLLSDDPPSRAGDSGTDEGDRKESTPLRTGSANQALAEGSLPGSLQSPPQHPQRSASAKMAPSQRDSPPVDIVKLLTESHFGQVYVVKDPETQVLYLMHACKKDHSDIASYRTLMSDMACLENPYIFQQVHHGETADMIFAVYTYAIDQSLFVHLRQHRRLPENVARLFVAEVVLALEYLHKQDRIFSKLEPETIFLDEDGHACLSDFMLAYPRGRLPMEERTPEYKSPELLKGKEETTAADWWRLGILLYELTVGFPPFRSKTHDADELATKITTAKPEELRFPPFLTTDGQDLIRQLLAPEPSGRLGAAEVERLKSHPFFKEIDWGALALRQVESPDWVDESLQNERRSARAKELVSQNVPKACYVLVHVLKARGLPGLKPNGVKSDPYCKVVCEDHTMKTAVCRDTVTPVWDEVFTFGVSQHPRGDVAVKVYHHDDAMTKHARIGMVTVPLTDLKTAKHLNAWYSVIGQDCIAHGEVLVSITWVEKAIVKKFSPSTKSPQAFADAFKWTVASGSGTLSPPRSPVISHATLSPRRVPTLDVLPSAVVQPPSPQSPMPPPPSSFAHFDLPTSMIVTSPRGTRNIKLNNVLRNMVSQNKLRYQEDGFDLDLSYITDRIIAMGFPAESLSGVYRNPMSEVQKFFDQYHPEQFKVYNLCSEAKYPHEKFHGMVGEYPFDDHNCPPFQTLVGYCEDVQQFLSIDAENVVATHCKAGKGRTGLAISCFLVYSGVCPTAKAALDHFAIRRTADRKGVSIPSQVRYVRYFESYVTQYVSVNRPFPMHGIPRVLTRVRMSAVPNFDVGGGCDPYFLCKRPDGKLFFDYRKTVKEIRNFKKEQFIDLDGLYAFLQGDVKFAFFDWDKFGGDDKMFAFWINTNFVENNYLCLTKSELDSAVKDKSCKHFPVDFKIELYFATPSAGAGIHIFDADGPDADRPDGDDDD